MATTIHVPPELLARIDRRAKELGVSRNRFIVRALEKLIDEETRWSQRFLETLVEAAEDNEGQAAVSEMMRKVAARRTRKTAVEL